MSVGKARNPTQSGAPENYLIRVGYSLTLKY
jgi:hypothetical protein